MFRLIKLCLAYFYYFDSDTEWFQFRNRSANKGQACQITPIRIAKRNVYVARLK